MANLTATLESGDKVVLKSDGTWEYVRTAELTSEPVFRRSSWGMGQAQVRALEDAHPDVDTPEAIMFTGFVGSFECQILYFFAQGKLTRAKYSITTSHSSPNMYFDDCESLRTALVQKYGQPTDENLYWSDYTYREDPQDWGLALSMGHCSRYVQWFTPETSVILYLTGDNYEVDLGIEYASQELKGLEEAQKSQRLMEEL